MSRRARIGGLKVKNVEAALLAEEQALTTVHVAVTKQLRRLEAEEQLLQEMLRQAEQEEAEKQGQQAQPGQRPPEQPARRQAQQARQQQQQEQPGQQHVQEGDGGDEELPGTLWHKALESRQRCVQQPAVQDRGIMADGRSSLLGSPASQKRREEILSRIDSLIQEELESQLPLPSVDELVADDFKESERRKLRTVFDFDLWKRHRSSSRYSRHMFGLLESRTVRWIGAPLAYCVALSLAVGVYHNLADAGIVPEVLPELKTQLPIQLTSAALSTLLVLRTNTSYQRWDEARKMWGLIVNRSRDFTRQALGYIPDSQPDLQDMLCRWVVAYSRSLMCHLRSDEDLYRELSTKLKPQELEALMSSSHRPNYTVQASRVLTAILQAAKLPGVEIDPRDSGANVKASALVRMDEQLTQFADVTGGCERILRTPVPLMYTRHNSRMLTLWMTLLPFSLWDTCGWATPFVVVIVAFLLLGVKEIGLTIEEPFSILPLETICNTIETNVWELHRAHSTAAAEAQQEAQRGSWSQQAQQAQQGPQQVDADLLVGSLVSSWGGRRW
ncbi:hypothetical protein COHA_002913 [Chlorella ohadii]|uniref:Uncharacterized protein n=1 Tax=Chlorella ohadii TaxID=2649997 RepID=A0AAD5DWM3_9CHLO|nr:hypothetical protein COHA_002913 [Chlorella ohadii]